MLFLVCELGAQRYAIDASQIAEVLPLITIDELARTADEVAGVFVYRGAPVPVIDLSRLLEGRPAERRLSTRLVMVHCSNEGDGGARLLGLLVEKATETIRREAADFRDSGVVANGARYLGPVVSDARGLVRRLDIASLVSTQAQTLFERSEEQRWSSPTSKTC